MPTTLDSQIFGSLFSDPEISQLFTDEAYVRALVAVEAALARAEARVGMIPQGFAEQISNAADAKLIDIGALNKGTMRSGFPIIALVQEIRRLVGEEAAPYVHWGATTQDIMDTACMLQVHAAGSLLDDRLDELAQQLGESADRHRAVVLAARTHGQQALPISLGLKIASWLAPILRQR
jgi:3-carboxy-cis,cis-muconate cycloisomerase